MNNSVNAAFSFLCKRMPSDWDCPHWKYVSMLMEFQDKKGDEAIEGLAGFYLFAIRNIKGDDGSKAIHTTFAHDLNERNDAHSLPRSDSYAEVWREEHKKYTNA